MATTKSTPLVMANDVTLTASAGDQTFTLSGTVPDLVDGYGAKVLIKITNGGTGPTLPADVTIERSFDNSNWYADGALVGDSVNSSVTSWQIPLDIEDKYIRVLAGGNTGQDVTCRVEIAEVSRI